ncbi:MAG: DUF167 domain-containing protein [Frankiaceae bacterium]|jgi:uncharacterized protein YggU (UPF0235/DUF167 family)|nr:DUF167 domain-containing protein [Frankiaceae bacterium]
MRIAIRVRPGSSHPGVGGSHGGALVVRVAARAVDGKATAAALAALAEAVGVRPAEVRLVTGATSRTKIVELPERAATAIGALLGEPADGRPPRP